MITLTFNEIFKDYETFKAHTGAMHIYSQEDAESEAFNKHLFYCLYNRYVGVSLAYDIEDLFLAEFDLAYQQYFEQFLNKKKILQAIHNLSLSDYEILTENISNFSNNPNYITDDAWETLSYISQQTRGRAKAGKLTAYLNALYALPDAQINEMIKKFDYLWLDILPIEDIILY